jgi:hypothetical protein
VFFVSRLNLDGLAVGCVADDDLGIGLWFEDIHPFNRRIKLLAPMKRIGPPARTAWLNASKTQTRAAAMLIEGFEVQASAAFFKK